VSGVRDFWRVDLIAGWDMNLILGHAEGAALDRVLEEGRAVFDTLRKAHERANVHVRLTKLAGAPVTEADVDAFSAAFPERWMP
jgi:hypothetical protein